MKEAKFVENRFSDKEVANALSISVVVIIAYIFTYIIIISIII